jgi:hypothetical protein
MNHQDTKTPREPIPRETDGVVSLGVSRENSIECQSLVAQCRNGLIPGFLLPSKTNLLKSRQSSAVPS